MQNMFNDEITQSIAKTVSDVLEGKKPDVSDYVKQNKDGQFEVVDAKGTVLKAFGRKDEAEGFAYKNLSKLQEVEEPRAKGEKEFKKALKKFDADSPADMDDEKKKEFFNYIDKNYKAKKETD